MLNYLNNTLINAIISVEHRNSEVYFMLKKIVFHKFVSQIITLKCNYDRANSAPFYKRLQERN